MLGKLIINKHASQHYKTFFNQNNGFFLRAEENGYPEPFWSKDGPELLDVSITNYCGRECEFCYRQANKKGHHILFNDMQNIVDQAKKAGVLQMALGGGNPNQHPDFIEILHLIRDNNIVPTYTTNGDGLSDEVLNATKECCGAMAVSLYAPYEGYEELLNRIYSFGIRCNLHIILKNDTIDILSNWLLEPPPFFKYVNALIVLNYKPIIGDSNQVVKDSVKLRPFYDAVSKCTSIKIGFDSCCIPGIVSYMKNAKSVLVESCESARFSAFISEDMKMFPCSFMAHTDKYGDLRKDSLLEIWTKNKAFIEHRNRILENQCPTCKHQSICNGGCVFMSQINQCQNP